MTESAGRSNASTPTAETSVTGLSDEFCEAVRAYARSKNETMRLVYDEAILTMSKRINGGEEIFFPAVTRGQGKKVRHIRLSSDAKDELNNIATRFRIHKTIVFHKAVRDYLLSNGVDAPE